MNRFATIAKGLGALVVFLGLVVAVPLLLWRAGGPPVPQDAFEWEKVKDAINTGITPGAVTGILLFVCWVAWAVLAWALIAEAWNRAFGRSSRQVRGMTPVQLFAGKIVAAAFFVGTGAFAGGGAGGTSGALPPRAVNIDLVAPDMATGPVDLGPSPLAAPQPLPQGHYLVQERDTLQRIATEQLGDPMRWREIWDLNRNRVQPDGRLFSKPEFLRAGWQLELPADAKQNRPSSDAAATGLGLEPSAATAALQGTPERGAVPAEVINLGAANHVVEKGDSLWKICEQYLGREPTWAEINAVVAANVGRMDPAIVDPNLIYPGQELDVSVLGVPADSSLIQG